MGDPKKLRKTYATPLHMWQKARVDEEKQLVQEYGLKNRKEVWKAKTMLRNMTKQAKKLTATKTSQAEKERGQLLKKAQVLGLLQPNGDLNTVLGLTLNDMLERRLQTVVFRKSLACTMTQARQFIVHRHIMIGSKKVNAPSYLVRKEEETQITFAQHSALADKAHPERAKQEKKKETPEAAEEKEKTVKPHATDKRGTKKRTTTGKGRVKKSVNAGKEKK